MATFAKEPLRDALAISIETLRGKGILHELTGVILRHGGDITSRGPKEPPGFGAAPEAS